MKKYLLKRGSKGGASREKEEETLTDRATKIMTDEDLFIFFFDLDDDASELHEYKKRPDGGSKRECTCLHVL